MNGRSSLGMILHVARMELRLARRALLIWTAVLVGVVALYLSLFESIQEPVMVEALKAMPESLLKAFSFTPAMIADVNSYYGVYIMGYLVLLATIYGLMHAGGSVAREPDLGAVEFLYTRPVTRRQVTVAKIAAFVVAAVVLWVAILAVSTLVGWAVAGDAYDLGRQRWTHLAGFCATLAAGGAGFVLAPFFPRAQTAISAGVGVGLASFVLHALSQLADRLRPIGYLSLQRYAALDRAAAGDPDVGGLLVLVAVFLVGSLAGTMILERKDFS
ncbi:ABC transporter permease subunit [Thermaerobacter sp. PB12/4term]|uniref:ABC transporter permease subunit n=1 Tax=Thermaerobacter sp. PB12/4term TaxID=2293838 RepID=UPI000E329FAF|nr:ABC transporter permease subunit [Thermaerobacter sp. PB12/4term]QIA27739.1 ABC transporter permease subunit [Thermaerobacter sp. PB12/4term]